MQFVLGSIHQLRTHSLTMTPMLEGCRDRMSSHSFAPLTHFVNTREGTKLGHGGYVDGVNLEDKSLSSPNPNSNLSKKAS